MSPSSYQTLAVLSGLAGPCEPLYRQHLTGPRAEATGQTALPVYSAKPRVGPGAWTRPQVAQWLQGVLGPRMPPAEVQRVVGLLGTPSGEALLTLSRKEVARRVGSDAVGSLIRNAVLDANATAGQGCPEPAPTLQELHSRRAPPGPPPPQRYELTPPEPGGREGRAQLVEEGCGPRDWSAADVARWLRRVLRPRLSPAEVRSVVQRLGPPAGPALLTLSAADMARAVGDPDLGSLIRAALLDEMERGARDKHRGGRPRRPSGPGTSPPTRPRARRRRRSSASADGEHLCSRIWKFILELLMDPNLRSVVRWLNKEEGVFLFVDGRRAAELWGERRALKREKPMDYGKMTRGIRYYNLGYFAPFRKRNAYKFGPNAGWRELLQAHPAPAAAGQGSRGAIEPCTRGEEMTAQTCT